MDEIAWLRDNSPAWRLLRADNAPLVLSFLHLVFVAENVRSISATELASRFRKLDRQLREKMTGWRGGKGELLDDVLDGRESIAGSDQGRSFQAFYGFLLSAARQAELSGLLDQVHSLAGIAERDTRLRHVHYDWLDAAERTQATVRQCRKAVAGC
jgi:hypothetical protein